MQNNTGNYGANTLKKTKLGQLRGKSAQLNIQCGNKSPSILQIDKGIDSPKNDLPKPESSFYANDDFPEILVVDDDSFNILAIESILKKMNIRINKAFNGE